MRILLLSSWFPYPPNNGSRIRAYNLLKQVAHRHEVDLVSFAQEGYGEERGDLLAVCRSVATVPWVSYSPTRLRALVGFFAPAPRSVVDTYRAEMARLVAGKLNGNNHDLVVASELPAAVYVPRVAEIPAIMDEFQAALIKDAFTQAREPLRRFRAWLTWTKQRRYVARLVGRFAACTVASPQEKANLEEIAPAYGRVRVVPNGVDTDSCRLGLAEPVRGTLIYPGALTWSANYDAVAHFLADILPRIRAAVQRVEFRVTGSTQGVNVDQLPNHEGATFTGYVDDIRPLVAGSWACVVPLRVGGGTRLKILEAMALGTPVVSTSKGAEGLEVTHEKDILIADGPADFAAQVVRLLGDVDLRQRLAENGRQLVEQKYDWRVIGRQFNELIDSVADARRVR